MAKRDVELIVRAKDEASRALASISSELEKLRGRQDGTAGSSQNLGASLVQAAAQMAKFEQATGLITAAADRGEAALAKQRASMTETAAQLRSVTAQLAEAKRVVDALQTGIVNTRIGGGNTDGQVAALAAAKGAISDLETQQRKLTATLNGQQATLATQEGEFRQLASTANAATAAMTELAAATARQQREAQAAARNQQTLANILRSTDRVVGKSASESAAVFAKSTLTDVERQLDALERRAAGFRGQRSGAESLLAGDASVDKAVISATRLDQVLARVNNKGKLVVQANKEAAAEAERVAKAQAGVAAEMERQAKAAEAARKNRSGAERLMAGQATVDRAQINDVTLSQVLQRTNRPSTDDSASQARVAASQAAARATDAEAAAIQRLLDRTNPLAVIQRQLAKDTEVLRQAMQRGKISAEQFAKAEAELVRQSKDAEAAIERVGKGAQGKPALFGLRPYELTNLGYQVNDLVTQVASGTPLIQAFAQQGGQILQLLPDIGSKITAVFKNPYILASAAALAVFATALNKASDNARRLEKVEGMLAGIGQGANASAKEIAGTVKAIENLGLAADDALGVARQFITQGLDVTQMKNFAKAAKDTATATGVDLKDAMADMTDGLTKGYDAVAELDNKLQFLTVAEREEIRALFDAGRAQDARTRAVGLYMDRMQEMADKSRGDWAKAVDTLERAFDRLLDRLAETDIIKSVVRELGDLAELLDYSLTRFDDLNLQQVETRIGDIEQEMRDGQARGLKPTKRLEDELKALRAQREVLKQQQRDRKDFNDEESAAAQKRNADELKRIQNEDALAKASSAKDRIRIAGEQAYQKAVNDGFNEQVAQARKQQAIDKQKEEERKKRIRDEKELNKTIKLNSPLKGNYRVTSGYSTSRRNPVTGKVEPHLGTDYATPVGTPVYAPAAGRVAEVGNKPGGNGKYIVIDHGRGTKSTLLHLSDNSIVAENDIVEAGQMIGKTGNTGRSTGPHLDYRVTVDGKPVDPQKVIGTRVKGGLDDVLGDQAREEEKRAEQQADFNLEIDQAVERRTAETAEMAKQAKLSGVALLDAKREAAVAEEIRRLEQEAAEKGLVFDEQRREAVEKTVRAEFDVAHARERATAAIDDNSAERDALLGRLELAEKAGDTEGMRKAEAAIAAVDKKLLDAIATAEAFWRSMGDNPQSRAALQNLANQRSEIQRAAFDRDRQRVERPVEQAQSRRSGLMEQIDFFREAGQTSVVEQLTTQLRALDAEYLTAIDRALSFWQTQTGPEAQAAILNLQNLRNEVIAAQNEFAITGGQIQNAFAGSLTDSFKLFAQRLVETKDVLGSLGQAALSFAASFLEKLAEMSLQALALKAASALGFGGMAEGLNGALGLSVAAPQLMAAGATLTASGATLTASGATLTTAAAVWQGVAVQLMAAAAQLAAAGAANGIASAASASAGFFHEGGLVGMATRKVAVHPAWFRNATRYHSGGIAGLKPDEVPAILRRGEEVLTTADARHRANMGTGGASGGTSISQILAIGDNEIASAMSGAAGDKVHMTWLRRNRETIRQELQG